MPFEIYEISNKITGHRYVGSSTDAIARLKWHVKDLGLGRHHNQRLQENWNLYGLDALQFRILQRSKSDSRKDQLIAEQQWIERIKPELNVSLHAVRGSSAEAIARKKCRDYFAAQGWVFKSGLEYYAWDAPNRVLSLFGIRNGESFRRRHPQPDYVLESGKTSGGTKEYVLVGEVSQGDVQGNGDND